MSDFIDKAKDKLTRGGDIDLDAAAAKAKEARGSTSLPTR